jgi:hypothetical protein
MCFVKFGLGKILIHRVYCIASIGRSKSGQTLKSQRIISRNLKRPPRVIGQKDLIGRTHI